ncbi:transmembrane protein 68-like [Heterocephalus glaber]|uniref:Transmembrane protein 68-like n=1 Tax=Heterocephalus glaber TaxID=10181 RepID=A0AAX6Q374_HETGA|nr:transmembrane protein 68-like [Heterocephalus glaber]
MGARADHGQERALVYAAEVLTIPSLVAGRRGVRLSPPPHGRGPSLVGCWGMGSLWEEAPLHTAEVLCLLAGFSLLLDVFCALHGPREKCVEILRSGHLLAILPGRVQEALISDETYNIIWSNRKGFAQVAINAKAPIIPMFTQNIREGFRSLGGTRLFRWLYEKFRYPFAPMYGDFPVKLRTYLGDPIPYDTKITAELAEKVYNTFTFIIGCLYCWA